MPYVKENYQFHRPEPIDGHYSVMQECNIGNITVRCLVMYEHNTLYGQVHILYDGIHKLSRLVILEE
jgi:hypothetical protein